MKKLSLLAIFLLVSCAEEVSAKSELDRCVDANVSLIQNITFERLSNYPELLKAPVKVDLYNLITMQSLFYEMEMDANIGRNILALNDKKTALKSFNFLKDNGVISNEININLNADEVYFTVVSDDVVYSLGILMTEYPKYPSVAEMYKSLLSFTIKLFEDDTIKDIAKNTCYSQGIY